ncbi:Rrf2 family transcriptional regulator [Moraxella sp. FZFQ2102]|uniref:Rrf2 family transcriptional regulator n=1 Tax=Moraxella sp. FZFQ2102 TaxID=2953752 RepID=UPI00209BEDB7|nr:Rrf2 family transcriptional regulator [Moraxella sp. FZFQ2102]USZ13874.1 Rrf2 family transcriptional regulator [Moraxella sp. FZFQ2102]
MRLTQYSDFALRSLIYLAVKPRSDEIVNISDIAQAYNISKNHLTKIIHQLSKLGYIDTVRGKNGGIRLAMHPRDINIGQLFRYTEHDFALVQCFDELYQDRDDHSSNNPARIPTVDFSTTSNEFCVIAPACTLKSAIAEATEAFMAVLDRYTLDDFIKNKDELLALLD